MNSGDVQESMGKNPDKNNKLVEYLNKRKGKSSVSVKEITEPDSSVELIDKNKLFFDFKEFEKVILGACIIEKGAYDRVSNILTPDCFYGYSNKLTYELIKEMNDNGEPVDILTLSEKSLKKGLNGIISPYYITTLIARIASTGNLEAYSISLKSRHLQSRLNIFAWEFAERCRDDNYRFDNLEENIKFAKKELDEVEGLLANGKTRSFTDIVDESTEILIKNMSRVPGEISGVTTGFWELDEITDGLQKTDMIVLAARPGMGKTSLVLNIVNSASKSGKKVGVFSLEMSAGQLVLRLKSSIAMIDSYKIKRGILNQSEFELLKKVSEDLKSRGIYIDDTPSLPISQLRAIGLNWKREGLDLLVVDYLQLINGELNGNREAEISKISRALKALAKELKVPVIALSQLNRAVESRQDKRPMLSDLRESGAIEQDADMVWLLWRPEYYGITEDESGESLAGVGELIIAKHRNGSLGEVYLRWIGNTTTFVDFKPKPTQFPSSGIQPNEDF